MSDPLTIESLARAIHDDEIQAARNINAITPVMVTRRGNVPMANYDDAPEKLKLFRMEQARLMWLRIMR